MPISEVHISFNRDRIPQLDAFKNFQEELEIYLSESGLAPSMSSDYVGEIIVETKNPEELEAQIKLKAAEADVSDIPTFWIAEVWGDDAD